MNLLSEREEKTGFWVHLKLVSDLTLAIKTYMIWWTSDLWYAPEYLILWHKLITLPAGTRSASCAKIRTDVQGWE